MGGLKGDFELNPQSLLYKMVVSKYRILTPFSKRHSDLEFFWDKKNKNVVINKFYAKAKIDKDGSNVANVLISTNQKPYKFHVFLPALLGKLRPGMQEVDVDFDHNPGTSLEMKVNHAGAKFKGFKNARWGDYSVNRDLKWGSSNKKLSLDITGDADFGAGPLASSSPVQTEVKLNFDVPSADLNGKFMKV